MNDQSLNHIFTYIPTNIKSLIMITFPCAKINLGLNVVSKRDDGYHDIETIFYPIPLCDALEIYPMDEQFPSPAPCDLKMTGGILDCNEDDNLVIKAYNLLAAHHDIPSVHAHLKKNIPSQAGLGGGSSDAAFMLTAINEAFQLHIDLKQLQTYAARLGADCAFFVSSRPAYATGIGEKLTEIDIDSKLKGKYLVIVKPDVSISTRTAYSMITPARPKTGCLQTIQLPIDTWKDLLTNDFEGPMFTCHPQLREIKDQLYAHGALYAQMSGSGSAFYGIFNDRPEHIGTLFPEYYTTTMKL